ncbi:MAG: radical SAM protein [Deltaproteobacteria bacterium]|nr:radical SAM protein [Deltaproteobacteria bacterium]
MTGSLKPIEAWHPPAPGADATGRVGFIIPGADTRRSVDRIWVNDLEALRPPAARAALATTLANMARGGPHPQVDITGVDDGDDLIEAIVLTLYLQFKAPDVPVHIFVDQRRIHGEVYRLFAQAMSHPGRLLKTLDHVVFARLHYLVGQQDHRRIERLAPQLPIIERCADGDPRIARRLAERLDVRKRNLQLMTTRRCQLRCVYCPVDKREADLSSDHAFQAIDLLLKGSRDRYRVDFAGGEPLLRKDWVREVIEGSHRRARELGKRDSYYLVTNCIELSEDFCRFLADYDVELEISIDGDEPSHNRNKIAVDRGINPYRALVRNFERLRHYDIGYNAVLVFTPDTFPSLGADLEHILSLGFRNIAINYAIGCHWTEEIITQYVELIADFVDRYDMLSRGEEAPFFIKNLRYKSEPTVLNSELMVDTDGSLHLLSEWQFEKGLRRRPPPWSYALGELSSIDDVFFTKAQVYHLLYEVYRDDEGDTLALIHNNVETGLQVSRQLGQLLGG